MPVSWLADIPFEVREMVYTELFTNLRVRPFELLQDKPQNDQERHAGFSLFLVNKRVYAESRPIFVKEATFDLHGYLGFANPCSVSVDPVDLVEKLVRSKNLDIRHIQRVICLSPSTLAVIAALKAKMDAAAPGCPTLAFQEVLLDRTAYVRIRNHGAWSDLPVSMVWCLTNLDQESALSAMLPPMPPSLKSATTRYTVRNGRSIYLHPFEELVLDSGWKIVTLNGKNLRTAGRSSVEASIIKLLQLSKEVQFVWEE